MPSRKAPSIVDRSTSRSSVMRMTLGASSATMAAAWDAGIRYYDTAPWYGRGLSEHRIGHGVYERLGFRDVEEYTLLTRPPHA